jgi:hypothetical protein
MKNYSILLFIVLSSYTLFAQSAGLNVSVGIPTGEFKDQVDRAAIGGNLEIFFFSPREHYPFTFGIDLGYYNYGYQSDEGQFYDGPYFYDADVSRTNNIARLNAIFRVQPYEYSSIMPYFDMFIGPSYLYTKTSITDRFDGSELANNVDNSSWIWNYGIGGGLLIQLTGKNANAASMLDNLYLDLKVRYNMSTLGEYMTENSIKVDPSNGDLYFTPAKTKVEFISVSAGLHVTFSSIMDGVNAGQ